MTCWQQIKQWGKQWRLNRLCLLVAQEGPHTKDQNTTEHLHPTTISSLSLFLSVSFAFHPPLHLQSTTQQFCVIGCKMSFLGYDI